MKRKKIKRILSISLLATVLVSSGFLKLNALENSNFILTAKSDAESNSIRLEWTNLKDCTYKIYQKKEGDNTFQSIGATNFESTKKVRVLNIYPNVGNNLKGWMENANSEDSNGYGRGIISVDEISISDFNSNPNSYLKKDSDGNYNYEVIMFGSYDSNNGKDLTNSSYEVVKDFIENGGGALFGHDTIRWSNGNSNDLPYFGKLSSYVNLTPSGTYWNSDSLKGSSDKITIRKKGLLTNYPWQVGDVGSVLTVPNAHNVGQVANGDIWLDFNNVVSNNRNHYLTTYNNCAMIQTGHSNGEATPDEQKLLANTLFYLNQLSTDNFLNDFSGQDVVGPNMPIINNYKFLSDDLARIHFSEATDNGSRYEYYVEASGKNNGEILRSNTVTETITSGIKGYSYVVDDKDDTIPDNIIEQTNNADIDVNINSDIMYLHIKAIDNAGNEGEVTHHKIDRRGYSAGKALELAEQQINKDNILNAESAISKLDDGALKTEYINRLDKVKEELEKIEKLIQDATNIVEKAEGSLSQDDIDIASEKVNALPDGPEKDKLIIKLDEIQAQFDKVQQQEAEKLQEATKLIEKAEGSLSQYDVDNARDKINALIDSSEKDNLIRRLDKVQAEIDKVKQEEATQAVKKAESTLSQTDVDKAQDLIDMLPDSTDKDNLQHRLNKVKEQIANSKLILAEKLVEKAERLLTTDSLEKGKDYVDGLADSPEKEDLINRLEIVKNIIQDNVIDKNNKYAEQLVRQAERLLTNKSVDKARSYIDTLPESNSKSQFLVRLILVEEKMYKRDNDYKYNYANELVIRAERYKTNEYIQVAEIYIETLEDRDEKSILLQRLENIK